jgi:nucleoside-diphosphate-sugar epimerase
VIARPGIVVGAGGPLQHWGIGRCHGAGAVRIWGDGRNVIPLVLVEDVADALVRILDAPDVVGRSFNLVGEPLMTARDYFEALREKTGTRIEVAEGSLTAFFLADLAKHLLKRHVLRKRDLDGAFARRLEVAGASVALPQQPRQRGARLAPEADCERFRERAFGGKSLFGF